MSLLNFDGPAPRQLKKPAKIALALAIAGVVVSLASTLAANISINSGPVEFGQGVAQTTACDDAITVTPRSTFINSSSEESQITQSVTVGATGITSFAIRPEDREKFYVGMSLSFTGDTVVIDTPTVITSISGLIDSTTAFNGNGFSYPAFDGYNEVYEIDVRDDLFMEASQAIATFGGAGFRLSGIDLSDIDATEGKCRGKTLTIKAYGDTETAALASYSVYVGTAGFTSYDGTITDSNAGTSSSAFSLHFTAATIAASDVYKITIESSERANNLLDQRVFLPSEIGIGISDVMAGTIIPVECTVGVCTSEYLRIDALSEMGAVVDRVIFMLNSSETATAETSWMIDVAGNGSEVTVSYGYIEHFNGSYGVFVQTIGADGAPSSGVPPLIFSLSGPLPLTAPGGPAGTLSWNSTSTDRYVE